MSSAAVVGAVCPQFFGISSSLVGILGRNPLDWRPLLCFQFRQSMCDFHAFFIILFNVLQCARPFRPHAFVNFSHFVFQCGIKLQRLLASHSCLGFGSQRRHFISILAPTVMSKKPVFQSSAVGPPPSALNSFWSSSATFGRRSSTQAVHNTLFLRGQTSSAT